MRGAREAFLDVSPGERRAVVTLDGRPERLWIERRGDDPALKLGARVAARVRRVEPALRTAFLDLGTDAGAVTPLAADVTEGAALEVEITAEPRRGKEAAARVLGPATGLAPRLLSPAPDLEERLRTCVGEPPQRGQAARDAADEAEDAALAVEHALGEGASLAIERTRALTAVDVDGGAGRGEAGRAARRTNLAALAEAARLLRLKGLGGLVVVDLVGGAQDEGVLAAAKAAFAPDAPGVVFGPLSRLGLLQLAKPWRGTPVEDRLLNAGRPTTETCAVRLVRALERAGRSDPGSRLEGVCDPAAAATAATLVAELGPRFSVRGDLGHAPGRPDIRRL